MKKKQPDPADSDPSDTESSYSPRYQNTSALKPTNK